MKLVREHINEKFADESDPIKDMGVGIFAKRNFEDQSEFLEFLISAIPTILKTRDIPEDILYSAGSLKDDYYREIRDYFNEYGTTFQGVSINGQSTMYWWPEFLRIELLKRGFSSVRPSMKY